MDFQCGRCKFPFKRNVSDSTPKTLDCGHTFCYNCLDEQQHQYPGNIYQVKCFECEKVTSTVDGEGLKDLRTNKILFALQNEVMTCFSCNITFGEQDPPHLIRCGHTVCKQCSDKKARCNCSTKTYNRKITKPLNHLVYSHCLQNKTTQPQGPKCECCRKSFTSYEVRLPQKLDCGCNICRVCLTEAYERAKGNNTIAWSISCPFGKKKSCPKTGVDSKEKLYNSVDRKILASLKTISRSQTNPSNLADRALERISPEPSAPPAYLVFEQNVNDMPSSPPPYEEISGGSKPIPVPYNQYRPSLVPEYSPDTVGHLMQEYQWNMMGYTRSEICMQTFTMKQTGMVPLSRH